MPGHADVQLKSWALTVPGAVRKHNEDNFISRPELALWAVADGAGGHQAGEVASGLIVSSLAALPKTTPRTELPGEIHRILTEVHQQLRATAAGRGANVLIASTFVCLVIAQNRYFCIWAGDSRAYLLRNGELSQISRDHSLVQELVDNGSLSAEEAEHHPHANVITRAVGADCEQLLLDEVSGPLAKGDRFMLCSDGLTKSLSEPEITGLLARLPGEAAPENLVDAAMAHGARDNVTVIVIHAG